MVEYFRNSHLEINNGLISARTHHTQVTSCGVWLLIGRFVAFRQKGRRSESRSNRHVWPLGKSFTRSCLWCFTVKLRHSIRAVSGASLSSSGLEEAL